jgi:hypothetical protein
VDRLVLPRLLAREDIRQFQDEFETRYREVHSPGNLGEIGDVAEAVNGLLQRYAPGSRSKLSHAFLVFVSRGVTGARFARKGAAF